MKRSLSTTTDQQLDNYLYSNDKALLNIPYIHNYLCTDSYWAKGIPIDLVKASAQGSFCFGVYKLDPAAPALAFSSGKLNARQVGFARVVSDAATFGYLADVFVDTAERGQGLSKKLMEFIFSFEEVMRFRRFMLGTRDAHGLYAQYGFKPLAAPDRFMEVHRPDVYKGV